jgi:hypothetical protein
MKDINMQITRLAYDRFSMLAAKRRRKTRERVSIKGLIEEASKLLKV